MIFTWGHTRRFNNYSGYFEKLSGGRIQKVAVHAGFTCPNRDGALSSGGCTYCNNEAFNPSYCILSKSVTQQIGEGIEFHIRRYRRAKQYLAYFQPYSNTYAPLSRLKEIFSEALSCPGIAGLVVSTRPDCMDDDKLDYFAGLSQKYFIIIEYGIESCNDRSLEKINRCHTFQQSADMIIQTSRYGIKTGAHLIFGLPGESREEMLKQVDVVSSLPLTTIKLHQLQIIKNTAMAEQFMKNPESFHLFSLDEYMDFIVSFTERLNPSFVIERISAETPPRFLIAPDWGLLRTDHIIQRFEKKLEEKNTWQGKLWGTEVV